MHPELTSKLPTCINDGQLFIGFAKTRKDRQLIPLVTPSWNQYGVPGSQHFQWNAGVSRYRLQFGNDVAVNQDIVMLPTLV